MKTPRVVLIALVSLAVAVPSPLFACGKERWSVKVGEDKDVAPNGIELHPILGIDLRNTP